MPDTCSVRPPQSGQDLSPRAPVPLGQPSPSPPLAAESRRFVLSSCFYSSKTPCRRALLASSGSGTPAGYVAFEDYTRYCVSLAPFSCRGVGPWGGRVSAFTLQLMCSLFLRLVIMSEPSKTHTCVFGTNKLLFPLGESLGRNTRLCGRCMFNSLKRPGCFPTKVGARGLAFPDSVRRALVPPRLLASSWCSQPLTLVTLIGDCSGVVVVSALIS